MFIYKIINIQTEEFYIGQTIKNVEYRFRKHKEMSIRGGGYKLHNSMRKYGVENFTIEILDTAINLNELNEKEIHYIDTLKPYYNILPGGQIRLTEKSIEKMRQSLKGKKHSKELIEKRFEKIRKLENDKQFLINICQQSDFFQPAIKFSIVWNLPAEVSKICIYGIFQYYFFSGR
jgi:group I intron endonuclease